MHPWSKILKNGLWENNPGFVQLLGLCPLLAVSNSLVNALGLGIATLMTLILTNTAVALFRGFIPNEIRIPVYVVIIAAVVTVIELLMNAYLHDLYTILGIFIPLIVTNCIVMGRAEAFATKQPVYLAAWDGFAMGTGFALVLALLGALREILGRGTLFAQAELLLGAGWENAKITLVSDYSGFLLAILPPGAFIGLGFLIALKNILDQRRQKTNIVPIAQTSPQAMPVAH